MSEQKIKIMESVYARNEAAACKINEEMTARAVFVVNVMGAPGTGKTTVLTRLIPLLAFSSFVIEGDIESDLDTVKLQALGIQATQINTGGACHLDAPLIAAAAKRLDLSPGFLFIENIGNLVCPAEFLIGEHVKLLVANVTEGSDKPYKYPLAFEKADAVLVNKSDLSAYLDFDADFFNAGVRKLNAHAPIFYVSGKTGDGFGEVAAWCMTKASGVIKELS